MISAVESTISGNHFDGLYLVTVNQKSSQASWLADWSQTKILTELKDDTSKNCFNLIAKMEVKSSPPDWVR